MHYIFRLYPHLTFVSVPEPQSVPLHTEQFA